jgi:hypothetical protein
MPLNRLPVFETFAFYTSIGPCSSQTLVLELLLPIHLVTLPHLFCVVVGSYQFPITDDCDALALVVFYLCPFPTMSKLCLHETLFHVSFLQVLVAPSFELKVFRLQQVRSILIVVSFTLPLLVLACLVYHGCSIYLSVTSLFM